MEIEAVDLFTGYINQKGKRTDIAQRANPSSQAWRAAPPRFSLPPMTSTQNRDQQQHCTNSSSQLLGFKEDSSKRFTSDSTSQNNT
jgi:hypothetical protein